MAKTIITASLTGTATQSPHLPMTPQAIAQDAIACWKAGAAIVHLHMRDDNGLGTMDKERFLSWKEIVADAAYEAATDAGLSLRDIDCVVIAYHGEAVSEAGGIGGSVSDLLGIAPVPTFPCSMNCAGGSVALNTGWSMVASGKYQKVLVLGFDKALDNINYTESINISYDTEYDYVFGFRHRDGFELMSNHYMEH